MIKFFRKIRQNLLRKNKFKKYLLYGVGEIILVVVGILIAISINNYKTHIDNKVLELQYLKRLEKDLQESIKRTTTYRDFQIEAADNLSKVIEILESCELQEENQDLFANGLFHMGKISPPILIDGTIRELQSTGKLLIIRNVKLRDQLTQLLGEYESKLILMPYANTRVMNPMTYIEEYVTFDFDSPHMGMDPVSYENMNYDLSEICNNKKILSAVLVIRAQTYEVAEWEKRSLDEFRSFLNLLQQEIEGFD